MAGRDVVVRKKQTNNAVDVPVPPTDGSGDAEHLPSRLETADTLTPQGVRIGLKVSAKPSRPKGSAGTPLPEREQIAASQVPTLQRSVRAKVAGGGEVVLAAGGPVAMKVPEEFRERAIKVSKQFEETVAAIGEPVTVELVAGLPEGVPANS